MSTYAFGFAWGLLLLGAFAGWGVLLNRALLPGVDAGFGLRAVWGMSLAVAAGGGLNLARAISPGVLLGIVAVGLLLLAIGPGGGARRVGRDWWRGAFRSQPGPILVLAGVVMFLYAGSVWSRAMHPQDDNHAYLVFPARMVQEGSMGDDPFNNRRLESSLGGQAFLQAFSACVLDAGFARLVDPGVGLLAAVAALAAVSAWRGGGPWASGAILSLAVFLPPEPHHNTSTLILPAAWVAALYGTFRLRESAPCRAGSTAVLVGLQVAALATLKSTVLPAAGLLLLAGYAAALAPGPGRRGPLATVAEALAASFVAAAATAPWMAAMKRSSGTWLYPLLGRGYHGAQYGTYLRPFDGLTAKAAAYHVIQYATDGRVAGSFVAAVAAFAALWLGPSRRSAWLLAATALALAAASTPLAVLLDPADSVRYTFAPSFALLGLCLAELSGRDAAPTPRVVVVALLAIGLAVGSDWRMTRLGYVDKALNLAAVARRGPTMTPLEDIAACRRAQAAVPAGEPLMVHMSRPYLLDFRRNPIYVVDWPGGASPPPGLPVLRGPDPLVDYLLARGIRYLAYSWADEAGFPRAETELLLGPRTPAWNRTTARHTQEFHESLDALYARVDPLYDDGSITVIDLQALWNSR